MSKNIILPAKNIVFCEKNVGVLLRYYLDLLLNTRFLDISHTKVIFMPIK